ncbi:hypothetical protein STV34_07510 [Streptococcus agalactiae]|nr:hypothetical protein [Streptococcus dysgalactiae]QGG98044.1 hypothetical protein EA459_05250 [Streptococcus dysgalactiae subsp. dysgalactiae]
MDNKDLKRLMDYSKDHLEATQKVFNAMNKRLDALEAGVIENKKKEIKTNSTTYPDIQNEVVANKVKIELKKQGYSDHEARNMINNYKNRNVPKKKQTNSHKLPKPPGYKRHSSY